MQGGVGKVAGSNVRLSWWDAPFRLQRRRAVQDEAGRARLRSTEQPLQLELVAPG
jgi:hypothetical protein